MTMQSELKEVPPSKLASARAVAHRATQLLTRAARANLPAETDDSHSSMTWDERNLRFKCQPISKDGKIFAVCLSLSPLSLSITRDGKAVATLPLHNVSFSNASVWLDDALDKCGLLRSANVALPYALPKDVADIETFDGEGMAQALTALSAWYEFASSVLTDFIAAHTSISPGPGPLRCWPHHFDIATFVKLEDGDPETARGIGIGLSPGDENYDQPYFYVNPWPRLEPSRLPDAPAPGQWHTHGSVGLITTGKQILSLPNLEKGVFLFLENSFEICQKKLGV